MTIRPLHGRPLGLTRHSEINTPAISRRDFLKAASWGVSALALRPRNERPADAFPDAPHLGRVTVGKMDVLATPDAGSPVVGVLYQDQVVSWQREVVGEMPSRVNQRFVETPYGFVWGGYLQPVRSSPNSPLAGPAQTDLGGGMWVEVTVPYADLVLENPPARAPWLQYAMSINLQPRFYYNQVVWVDQVRTDAAGQVWYRLNEKYGSGDIFWGPAEAFRLLEAGDMAPIHPEIPGKRILVRIWDQTLSCFEESQEVYFARISSGALYDAWGQRVDAWETPAGEFPIWRKAVSLPLSGGSAAAGWSLPAVGWVSLFAGTGVAIHSTYWHNNFGEPSSRGCVNASPADARWIFRWTTPAVGVDPGDVTVEMPGGTVVEVQEAPY